MNSPKIWSELSPSCCKRGPWFATQSRAPTSENSAKLDTDRDRRADHRLAAVGERPAGQHPLRDELVRTV